MPSISGNEADRCSLQRAHMPVSLPEMDKTIRTDRKKYQNPAKLERFFCFFYRGGRFQPENTLRRPKIRTAGQRKEHADVCFFLRVHFWNELYLRMYAGRPALILCACRACPAPLCFKHLRLPYPFCLILLPARYPVCGFAARAVRRRRGTVFG